MDRITHQAITASSNVTIAYLVSGHDESQSIAVSTFLRSHIFAHLLYDESSDVVCQKGYRNFLILIHTCILKAAKECSHFGDELASSSARIKL